jgi:hypothetical protein
MERHRITGEAAFDLLVRAGHVTGTTLAEVARALVETPRN